jgi:hypothetical protein
MRERQRGEGKAEGKGMRERQRGEGKAEDE